jgi:hypothetical protein
MTAIILLLIHEPIVPWVSTSVLGTLCLWAAAILTLWSMVYYLERAAPYLRGDAPADEPTIAPQFQGEPPERG